MKTKKNAGFTIIELLTVMSIIVIFISLLMPSLNAVRRYSKAVRQKGQFHEMRTGLEMFYVDFGEYPESSENSFPGGIDDVPYCGAQKLCEALLGKDNHGLHPDSQFIAAGTDRSGNLLYPPAPPNPLSDQTYMSNLRSRKNTYVDPEKFKTTNLYALFGTSITPYTEPNAFICDVFRAVRNHNPNGPSTIGMPVLYYRANTSKMGHHLNTDAANITQNIYDYRDNYNFTTLRTAEMGDSEHPIRADHNIFYNTTWNGRDRVMPKPFNSETYLLVSAGWDGFYGTKDDIFNFGE